MFIIVATCTLTLVLTGCGGSDVKPKWTTADVVQKFRQSTGCTLGVEVTGSAGTTLEASACGFPGSHVYVPAKATPIPDQAGSLNLVDVGDGMYVGTYGDCIDPSTKTNTKCHAVALGVGSELLAWTNVYDETEAPDNYGSACDWASTLGQTLGVTVDCAGSSMNTSGTKTTTDLELFRQILGGD